MKIVIEIKDTATSSRIKAFYELLQCNQIGKYSEWTDVIQNICKE